MGTAFGGYVFTGHVDPTAGVTIMPRLEVCPRCGVAKGKRGNARRGLCRDCADVVGPRDRGRWAA